MTGQSAIGLSIVLLINEKSIERFYWEIDFLL